MNVYKYEKCDFENPSLLFIMEDLLKSLFGEYFLYGPYIRSFRLSGDEKVLDFGCGGGIGSRCASRLLNRGGHLTCVDTSAFWTKKARKRLAEFDNVEIVTGDIRAMDIPDFTYDVVFAIHVIHDIEPSARQSIISALASKLRSGGILHIRELIRRSHGMPLQEIQSLLRNVGLQEIESRSTRVEYIGTYLHKPRS